jgi:hypothetical protein
MSGGTLPGGMAPAVGSGATAAELGSTAAGAGLANLPQMTGGQLAMRGLMGALTGGSQYGQNAPAIHKMLTGLMGQGQQQPHPQGGMPMQRPMMGAPMSFPGLAPQQGMTSPFGGQSQGQQMPSLLPWMGH